MKVSVVVPVYNVENDLENCVQSIIEQTYKNLEIILIDDGSTDNSGEICDYLGERDDRIMVIHKENGGLSDARNKGLEVCSGKFITFVDSDDSIPGNALEKMMLEMIRYQADLLIGGRTYLKGKKVYKEDIYELNKIMYEDYKEYLEVAIKNNEFRASACCKLYLTEIIKKNKLKFIKGYLHEDLIFSIQYLLFSKKIVVLKDSIYNYNISREGSITTKIKKKDLDSLILIQKIDQMLNENRSDIYKKKYFKSYLLSWINNIFIFKLFRSDISYDEKEILEILKIIKKDKTYREKILSYLMSSNISIKFKILQILFLFNTKIYLFVSKLLRRY